MGKAEARLIAALRRRANKWRKKRNEAKRRGQQELGVWTDGLYLGLLEAVEIVQKRAAREARRGKAGW